MTYQILFYNTGRFYSLAGYEHLEKEFIPHFQPFGGVNIDQPITRKHPAIDCKINFQRQELIFGKQEESGLFHLTKRERIKDLAGRTYEDLIKYHLETYHESEIKEVRELCHRPN